MPVVCPEDNQICCDVDSELGDLDARIIDSNMSHEAFERRTARANLERTNAPRDVVLQTEARAAARRRTCGDATQGSVQGVRRTHMENVQLGIHLVRRQF